MVRSALSVLGLVIALAWPHVVQAQAKTPNVVVKESTITATVERIERSSRVLTLASTEGPHSVYVDPSVKMFDDLKTGDTISVRYVESIVVQMRPGAKLSDVRDVTAEAQKSGNEQVVQQLRAVVKIEGIDSQGLSIEYRTQDGQKVLRPVGDKRLLEGLRVGDQIEITLTRERAMSIERVRR